jgi:hypothetical protein
MNTRERLKRHYARKDAEHWILAGVMLALVVVVARAIGGA